MRPLLLFTVFMLLAACGKNIPVDPCDPQRGLTSKGKHYLEDSLISEDGRFDYRGWAKYFMQKKEHYPHSDCIPVEKPETFEEQLNRLGETSDMER